MLYRLYVEYIFILEKRRAYPSMGNESRQIRLEENKRVTVSANGEEQKESGRCERYEFFIVVHKR